MFGPVMKRSAGGLFLWAADVSRLSNSSESMIRCGPVRCYQAKYHSARSVRPSDFAQNRMPAIGDLECAFVTDFRAAIVVKRRAISTKTRARRVVRGRRRFAGFAASWPRTSSRRRWKSSYSNFTLRSSRRGFCLHVLQLGRDETLAVRDGLFADVMRGTLSRFDLVTSM